MDAGSGVVTGSAVVTGGGVAAGGDRCAGTLFTTGFAEWRGSGVGSGVATGVASDAGAGPGVANGCAAVSTDAATGVGAGKGCEFRSCSLARLRSPPTAATMAIAMESIRSLAPLPSPSILLFCMARASWKVR